MSTALLFSGQGSQCVGMAKDLYEQFPAAAKLMDRANEVVGYSLTDLMFDGPDTQLKETRYTQPALLVHEAALLELTNAYRTCTGVAGHSLGEYSALYASGALQFDDALTLVQLRANLMFDAGNEIPGTMAAIVGLDDETVTALCDELHGVDGNVLRAANFNSHGQVVISGSADYVRQCLPIFKERGAKIVKELQVSGAFHSDLMESAKQQLLDAISNTQFQNSSVDVFVNVTGLPIRLAGDLKHAVGEQLTKPVQFTKTLLNMKDAGFTNFIEIGPGKVLQGLVKRTVEGAEISGLDTAGSVVEFLKSQNS
ncbi:MAG: ACP S-malonyltransferase [Ignavibacteria bacterium]|nr:ACP S-malonyltransferase [Ignavibacteria bacterium]